MGWQDRGYGRMERGDNPFQHPIMKLFFGSVYLGTYFGIRVRAHAMLLWYFALQLLTVPTMTWPVVLFQIVALFAIVLVHEFGHCVGARLVGGYAEDILLWPLGGLALTDTARRPWARFVTVACGPLVNVILWVITGGVLLGLNGFAWDLPINPFLPFIGSHFREESGWIGLRMVLEAHPWAVYLYWFYAINLSILFFNLLPIYPLDGGRLAQVALWKPLGYYKSMVISCTVGMVAAVMLGVAGLASGTFIMVGVAAMGFFTCLQERRMLVANGPEGWQDGVDLSAAYDQPDAPRKGKGRGKGTWTKNVRKRVAAEQAEQAKIDAILAKVHEKGLHSLTYFEKRTLKKATERQRRRDLAERL